MEYKIFLDDLRMPTDIYPNTDNSSWHIARNLAEFKELIALYGIPEYISFDNDLGASLEEGKDAAKWMVYEKQLNISLMNFKVHSTNPSYVREYIESLLNNWKKELNKRQMNEIRTKINFDIPADIIAIKNIFKEAGYKLFIVGGAIRDVLLEKTPKDYDLATDAVPDIVESLLSSHYKILGTGKKFGVINVFTESGDYEIATFRADKYIDGEVDLESFKNYLKSLNNGKYEEFLKLLVK